MSDEPTLPRLPAVSWDERSQSFSNNPRKRGRLTHAGNSVSSSFNSSDPAVFSSDDDPAIDNYVEGRRKRRYVGTWFSQEPTSSDSTFGDITPKPRAKRTWARQLDSGIFLGSDDAESETMSECPPATTPSRLRQLDVRPRQQANAAELQARKRIQDYVETGTEDVVLYSAGLTDLSSETIEPLKHLTRIPIVGRDVAFEQHPTQIRLNLASNSLTRLPGALFDVSTITMLTLRGNNLEELPPGIGKLCNLQSLNVSQNRLKFLPVEILRLFNNPSKLAQCVVHPNPFLEAPGADRFQPVNRLTVDRKPEGSPHGTDHRSDPIKIVTQCLGWSSSRSFDLGAYLTHCLSPFSHQDNIADLFGWFSRGGNVEQDPNGQPFPSLPSSSVTSLLECALRSCYNTDHLFEMQAMLEDGLPQLQALLQRAYKQKQSGGLRCSRCKKTMVIPASEWIEWRALFQLEFSIQNGHKMTAAYSPHSTAPKERAVPFLHRACCGRCGQNEAPESRWMVGKGWAVDENHLSFAR